MNSLAFCTAASATTLTTANTPPGRTEPLLRLDNLPPRDVYQQPGGAQLVQVFHELVPVDELNHFTGSTPRDQSRLPSVARQQLRGLERIPEQAARVLIVRVVIRGLVAAGGFTRPERS